MMLPTKDGGLRVILGIRTGAVFSGVLAAALSIGAVSSDAQAKTRNLGVTETTKPVSSLQSSGNFYALVIGIDNYQHLPHLLTPHNDAQEIASVLKDQYGFRTQLLLDATRDQIVEALDHYRHTLGEADNLLIYYAGHGYFDKDIDQAYWAPVDAGQDTYARWIIATEITGTAKAIPARHVLIISDSCYSGMLTRDAKGFEPTDRDGYLEKMFQRKSRNVISSGGDEPVADGDAKGHFSSHSVFANVLLQNLSQFQMTAFTAEQLFVDVKEQVGGRSKQVPEYSAIRDSLHEGGDFVFIRLRKGSAAEGVAIIHSEIEEPPAHHADEDKEAVRALLDNYEEAYASMDLRELKRVWPSLSKNQEKEIKRGFQAPGLNAVKVQLRNRTINVGGATANVVCDQWMVYTFAGRRQPPQTSSVQIQLTKDPRGSWAVSAVNGK